MNKVIDQTISLINHFFESVRGVYFPENSSIYSVMDASFTDPFQYFLDCTPNIEQLIYSLKECCKSLNNLLSNESFIITDIIFLYEEEG